MNCLRNELTKYLSIILLISFICTMLPFNNAFAAADVANNNDVVNIYSSTINDNGRQIENWGYEKNGVTYEMVTITEDERVQTNAYKIENGEKYFLETITIDILDGQMLINGKAFDTPIKENSSSTFATIKEKTTITQIPLGQYAGILGNFSTDYGIATGLYAIFKDLSAGGKSAVAVSLFLSVAGRISTALVPADYECWFYEYYLMETFPLTNPSAAIREYIKQGLYSDSSLSTALAGPRELEEFYY